jgi:hypothetical protein
MVKHILFACILLLLSPARLSPLQAASLKLTNAQLIEKPVNGGLGEHFGIYKAKKSRKGWFAKIFSKFEKKSKKAPSKPNKETGKKHLFICLGLIVLSIIAFALSGQGQVFSILGSVFAIGAAVFFILWLLNFLGKIGS